MEYPLSTIKRFWSIASSFLKKRSKMPPWLGKKVFHSSHRSNLLRKDKKFYGRFAWNEPNSLPHHWPSKALENSLEK